MKDDMSRCHRFTCRSLRIIRYLWYFNFALLHWEWVWRGYRSKQCVHCGTNEIAQWGFTSESSETVAITSPARSVSLLFTDTHKNEFFQSRYQWHSFSGNSENRLLTLHSHFIATSHVPVTWNIDTTIDIVRIRKTIGTNDFIMQSSLC